MSTQWQDEYKKQVLKLLQSGNIDMATLFGSCAIMSELISLADKASVKKLLLDKYGEKKVKGLYRILENNVTFINSVSMGAYHNATMMFPLDKQQDEFLDTVKDLLNNKGDSK